MNENGAPRDVTVEGEGTDKGSIDTVPDKTMHCDSSDDAMPVSK
jgi:hypothetical protein